jgi:hypothetical protein
VSPNDASPGEGAQKRIHNIITERGPDDCLFEVNNVRVDRLPDEGPCAAILVWKERFVAREDLEELRVWFVRRFNHEIQHKGTMLWFDISVRQAYCQLGGHIQIFRPSPTTMRYASPFKSPVDLNNLRDPVHVRGLRSVFG